MEDDGEANAMSTDPSVSGSRAAAERVNVRAFAARDGSSVSGESSATARARTLNELVGDSFRSGDFESEEESERDEDIAGTRSDYDSDASLSELGDWSASEAEVGPGLGARVGADADAVEPSTNTISLFHFLGQHTKSGRYRNRAVESARSVHTAKELMASAESDSDVEVGQGIAQRRVYAEKSFFFFPRDQPFRKLCVRLVEKSWFDYVVLGIIAVNTVFMCLVEPNRLDGRGCGQYSSEGWRNEVVEKSEVVFTVLFSIEAVLKMIAFGVVGKRGSTGDEYMRDAWNVLDFCIVVISIIAVLPLEVGSNISTLRVVRILRPLRTISMFPSLRLLIATMLTAFPLLANVMVFFMLFFCIFGIVGVQFFSGALKNRCYDVLPSTVPCESYSAQEWLKCIKRDSGDAVLLSPNSDQVCGEGQNGAYHCSTGQECLEYENPNYGFMSFDTVWWAWVVMFQGVTLEYWSPAMLNLIDAVSPAAVVWFIPVIFLGSFVILNLALAIVTMVYDESIVTELKNAGSRQVSRRNSLARSTSANSEDIVATISTCELTDSFSWWNKVKERIVSFKDRTQSLAKMFVESDLFFTLITASIVANTLCLAMEYDGMSDKYSEVLEIFNLIFTIIFMLEMVLKLAGLGLRGYVEDRMNWLDAAIVIISVIELGLNGIGTSRFTVLRTFRILRILKLIRSWKSLQSTLSTMWKTIKDLRSFVVILCLFVVIFALIGMQLFGGRYCELDETPRSHFDNFNTALITVVQVITHEDWPLVMYDTMYTTATAAIVYFVIVLVFGDFIILNSLIAILLSNFDNRKDTLTEAIEESKMERKRNLFGMMGSALSKQDSVQSRASVSSNGSMKEATPVAQKFARLADELLKRERRKDAARAEDLRLQRVKQTMEEAVANDVTLNPARLLEAKSRSGAASPIPLEKFTGKSVFGTLPAHNRFRQFCFKVVDDRLFDYFILLIIIASSITMAFETPKAIEDRSFARRMDIADYVFTSIFALELVLKWIALGMYNKDKHSYMKNPWNALDGAIVVVCILGICLGSGTSLSWVRALRTLRVLRPLRLLGRVQGLKVVINAILASLPSLAYVLIVSMIVWLIFAIAGMSLFMGKFKTCSDPEVLTQVDCVDSWTNVTLSRTWDVITSTCNDSSKSIELDCTGTFLSTTYVAREWSSADSNFDSFPRAMLTLFETTSGEGWTVTMFNAVDAAGTDIAAWYFIVFIVLSNFFLLNMCIGIVIDNFLKLSTTSMSRTIMSESQAKWVAQQRKRQFAPSGPFFMKKPKESWRKKLLSFVTHQAFDKVIMACIIFNTIILMLETDSDSEAKENVLEILNYVFTAIFTLEAVLKLGAFYPSNYFSSSWNTFDFVIVIFSIAGAIFSSGTGSSAFRAMRICRAFRMVRKWKALNTLFQTLMLTIPALGNVALLLSLMLYVYAILGVQVFGRIAFGEALNRQTNFRTVGNALVTLFRCMTGEGWQEIMYDCMNQENCSKDADCLLGECCGTYGAWAYFVSFVSLSSFVILNLLVAVVLDNYAMSRKEEENQQVKPQHVKNFRQVWKKFDPDLTGFIAIEDVRNTILLTKPPLGLNGKRVTDLTMLTFVRALNLQAGSKFIHYTDLIQALTAKAMGVDVNYLPREVRMELEADKRSAKRSSLLKLQRKVRRRAAIVRQLSEPAEEDLGLSLREIELAQEDEDKEIYGADGKPISMSVFLVVVKLQRQFRARQALKKRQEADNRG